MCLHNLDALLMAVAPRQPRNAWGRRVDPLETLRDLWHPRHDFLKPVPMWPGYDSLASGHESLVLSGKMYYTSMNAQSTAYWIVHCLNKVPLTHLVIHLTSDGCGEGFQKRFFDEFYAPSLKTLIFADALDVDSVPSIVKWLYRAGATVTALSFSGLKYPKDSYETVPTAENLAPLLEALTNHKGLHHFCMCRGTICTADSKGFWVGKGKLCRPSDAFMGFASPEARRALNNRIDGNATPANEVRRAIRDTLVPARIVMRATNVGLLSKTEAWSTWIWGGEAVTSDNPLLRAEGPPRLPPEIMLHILGMLSPPGVLSAAERKRLYDEAGDKVALKARAKEVIAGAKEGMTMEQMMEEWIVSRNFLAGYGVKHFVR